MAASVLIVGGGLAGLFTALKLAPMPCTVLSPRTLGEGAASSWAQGGMAAAISQGDSVESHIQDTLRAGAGLVDPEIAYVLAEGAHECVKDLLAYGVPFDRDSTGAFSTSREAAHSVRRVLRVQGDCAGRAIMTALVQAVRNTPSITVHEGVMVDKLLWNHGRVTGVRAWMDGGHAPAPMHVFAQEVVLATGGLGNLYQVTTNPPDSYGSGLGMAGQMGARISDPEFVQFHPTAFALGGDPAPLLTEALRGEGSLLLNSSGDRFMVQHHPDGELAPRDIVARGIFEEIRHGRGAFLHIPMSGAELAERFPTAYEACRAAGLDPGTNPIPVVPAAHYHMGGVWTDKNGRTSCPGLWAVGEVASTGAHGANRLASNSLLETVVFGARTAAALQKTGSDSHGEDIPFHKVDPQNDLPPGILSPEDQRIIATLRDTMHNHVGVIRTKSNLLEAFKILWNQLKNTDRPVLLNRLYGALFITLGAIRREESRGGHYRLDFPEQRPNFAHRTHLSLEDIHSYGSSYFEPLPKRASG